MSETFSASEVEKLEKYLRAKFDNSKLEVKKRNDVKDSVEVLISGEFVGVIYKDDDDGETSYDFNMAILDIDLS